MIIVTQENINLLSAFLRFFCASAPLRYFLLINEQVLHNLTIIKVKRTQRRRGAMSLLLIIYLI